MYLCGNCFIIELMNIGVTFQGVLVSIFNLSLLQCGIKNQWCFLKLCISLRVLQFCINVGFGEWVSA